MFSEVPWILVVLVGILLIGLIAGYFINRNMHKSGNSLFTTIHKKAFLTQFFTCLLCSLFGAFLMLNGELFGDNTTGIARIVGIIGICLIATASPIGIALKKKL